MRDIDDFTKQQVSQHRDECMKARDEKIKSQESIPDIKEDSGMELRVMEVECKEGDFPYHRQTVVLVNKGVKNPKEE